MVRCSRPSLETPAWPRSNRSSSSRRVAPLGYSGNPQLPVPNSHSSISEGWQLGFGDLGIAARSAKDPFELPPEAAEEALHRAADLLLHVALMDRAEA